MRTDEWEYYSDKFNEIIRRLENGSLNYEEKKKITDELQTILIQVQKWNKDK